MADATNMGTPSASGQMSGDATRQAAIRRMEKEQNRQITEKPIAQGRLGTKAFGAVQTPGRQAYSMTPPRRSKGSYSLTPP